MIVTTHPLTRTITTMANPPDGCDGSVVLTCAEPGVWTHVTPVGMLVFRRHDAGGRSATWVPCYRDPVARQDRELLAPLSTATTLESCVRRLMYRAEVCRIVARAIRALGGAK